MDANGTIRKDGDLFIVEVPWSDSRSKEPGIETVDTPTGKICRKVFRRKRIYLPGEKQLAIDTHLRAHDPLTLGVNGYSSLSDATAVTWGMRCAAMYFNGAETFLRSIIGHQIKLFRGPGICLVHGGGPGIDATTIKVARELGLPHLGFNCPEFMIYVPDDEDPVYVAANKLDYGDAFGSSLDILIAANGRAHAYEIDYQTAFKHHKPVMPVNIIKALSSNGGPPSCVNGKIEDAAAFFEEHFIMIGQVVSMMNGNDPWQATVDSGTSALSRFCRTKLSPARATAVR